MEVEAASACPVNIEQSDAEHGEQHAENAHRPGVLAGHDRRGEQHQHRREQDKRRTSDASDNRKARM